MIHVNEFFNFIKFDPMTIFFLLFFHHRSNTMLKIAKRVYYNGAHLPTIEASLTKMKILLPRAQSLHA
jgi:hypothetical protein